jgi:hypothetical protein
MDVGDSRTAKAFKKPVLDKDGHMMGQAVASGVGQSKGHGAILALRMRPAL